MQQNKQNLNSTNYCRETQTETNTNWGKNKPTQRSLIFSYEKTNQQT